MKKVLISGYYGFANTGDEAVLAAMVSLMRQRLPEVEITVLSHSPQETAACLQVQACNRWHLGEIIKNMRKTDLFVSGGGSLLQDKTSRKSFYYYLGLIILALFLGKKTMVYGQGIGPVAGKINKWLLSLVLKKVDLITVRDEASYRLLQEMKIKSVRRSLNADPVLAWQELKMPEADERIKKADNKKIGISFRDFPGVDKDLLAMSLDQLAAKNQQLFFLPFHEPEDVLFARELMDKMTYKGILIEVPSRPEQMVANIRALDLVIGMRLHALIMAAQQEIPFLAISYDPKVKAFAESMSQKLLGEIESIDQEQVQAGFADFWQQEKSYREKLILAVQNARSKAQENADLWLELLEKGEKK